MGHFVRFKELEPYSRISIHLHSRLRSHFRVRVVVQCLLCVLSNCSSFWSFSGREGVLSPPYCQEGSPRILCLFPPITFLFAPPCGSPHPSFSQFSHVGNKSGNPLLQKLYTISSSPDCWAFSLLVTVLQWLPLYAYCTHSLHLHTDISGTPEE